MIIYTIGFTKTSAEDFFCRLKSAKVSSVVDVRLKSDSQLAGFAKRKDLQFFVKSLLGSSYRQELSLAPTKDMLDSYKKGGMSWSDYEAAYLNLIDDRKVAQRIRPESLDGSCLLCSEDLPHQCHRRLAAEYLASHWNVPVEIRHL